MYVVWNCDTGTNTTLNMSTNTDEHAHTAAVPTGELVQSSAVNYDRFPPVNATNSGVFASTPAANYDESTPFAATNSDGFTPNAAANTEEPTPAAGMDIDGVIPSTEINVRINPTDASGVALVVGAALQLGTFRVSVSLARFFNDERVLSYMAVQRWRSSRWMSKRLQRRFNLSVSPALLSHGHLLHPNEQLMILKPGDTIE